MPLSFSRQQPFLATRGCGSGRPFRQRGGQRLRSQLPVSQDSGTNHYATFEPLPSRHTTMESAESIPRSLPRDAWDRIYQFWALPFGLSPAPWVFTKIMTQKMLVHVMGINLCQYLDDQCLRDTVQLPPDSRQEVGNDPKTEIPFSGRSVQPSFLPGHSNSGSISQNQSTDSLIPA